MKKYCFNIILSFFVAAGFLVGCDSDKDELATPRLFRPISIEVTTNTQEVVRVEWAPVEGASSYTLQIATDRNFGEIRQEVTEIKTNFLELTDGVLFSMTEYYDFYFRVKAVSDYRPESQFLADTASIEPFRLNVFDFITKEGVNTIPQENITKNKVKLTFTDTEVNEIRLEKDGQVLPGITLDQTDIGNGYKEVDVEPSTSYYAYIYNGTERKGRISFTSTPDTEVIIDNETDLENALKTPEANAYIRVKQGQYTLATVNPANSNNFTLTSFGEDKAEIELMFKPQAATPGNIVIESLILNGNSNKDGVFDFDKTSFGGGSMTIRNCEIRNYKKSLIYLRTSATGTAGAITIDNCIIDNLTNSQSFIDVRAAGTGNISITNTTIANINSAAYFIRYDDSNKTNNTIHVEIDKCSFYKVKFSEAFLGNKNGTLNLKNSILEEIDGKKSDNAAENTIDNSYFYNVSDKAQVGASSSCVIGAQSGYADAANGDFSPVGGARTAASGKKPAGDPRWIK